MTEQPSGRRDLDANGHEQGSRTSRGSEGDAARAATDSWERRAADLASGVQRWLIKTSARNVRDEIGDQVRKAFRGEQRDAGDVWATATTEPPGAANEAPECAWCPICRAARRLAESRAESGSGGSGGSGGSVLTEAADVVSGAVRDVLATIDSVLSHRPGDGNGSPAGSSQAGASPAAASPATTPRPARSADEAREPADEPDDRS